MEFIVIDFETTGLSAKNDRIIEIGCAFIEENQLTNSFSQLVNPGIKITNPKITEITGIDNSMLVDAPPLEEEMQKLHQMIEGKLIVAHNAPFDMGFLNNTFYRMGLPTYHSYLCTATMFRGYKKAINIPLERASLAVMSDYFQVVNTAAHRAGADAETTGKCLIKMCEAIDFRNFMEGASKRSKQANKLGTPTKTDTYMHYFDRHVPIETICSEMNVKVSTVTKYFLNWLHYGDASFYKSFILVNLPEQGIINDILRMRTQGLSTASIHRQMAGSVEYFVIQLVGRLGVKGIQQL